MRFKLTLTDNTFSNFNHLSKVWKLGDTFILTSNQLFSKIDKSKPAPVILINNLPTASKFFTYEPLDDVLYKDVNTVLDDMIPVLDTYVDIVLGKSKPKAVISKYLYITTGGGLSDVYGDKIIDIRKELIFNFKNDLFISIISYILPKINGEFEINGESLSLKLNNNVYKSNKLKTLYVSGVNILSSAFKYDIQTSGIRHKLNDYMLSLNDTYTHGNSISNASLTDDNKKVIFLPANKPDEARYYQKLRLGKFINKFKFDVSNSELETYVNHIIGNHISNSDFEVVLGDDIKHYYHENSYSGYKDIGTLGGSCMRHNSCSNYFNVYTKNKHVCSMLILKVDNELVGRALLWETDEGVKLMDRIYGVDSTISKFKKWATVNGYDYKYKQSYRSPLYWVNHKTKSTYSKQYKITLDTNHSHLPYFDTFYYAGLDFISNNEGGNVMKCRSTHGEGMKRTVTDYLGKLRFRDDCTYSRALKGWVLSSLCVTTNTGKVILSENSVWSDRYGYIERDTSVQCTNGDYVPLNKAKQLYNGHFVDIRFAKYIKYNRKWALPEDIKQCAFSGTDFIDEVSRTITIFNKQILLKYKTKAKIKFEQNG